MGNSTLKVISFSDNKLTDSSSDLISEVIYRKSNLTEMYLHWNRISKKGAELIFNQL